MDIVMVDVSRYGFTKLYFMGNWKQFEGLQEELSIYTACYGFQRKCLFRIYPKTMCLSNFQKRQWHWKAGKQILLKKRGRFIAIDSAVQLQIKRYVTA